MRTKSFAWIKGQSVFTNIRGKWLIEKPSNFYESNHPIPLSVALHNNSVFKHTTVCSKLKLVSEIPNQVVAMFYKIDYML